jgi:hypothetical protein
MCLQADSDVKGGMAGKLSNVVKEMVTNTAVNFDGTPKRQVLIMDEVDGMSAGDRGGIADLINTIKVGCRTVLACPSLCLSPFCRIRYPKSPLSASATTPIPKRSSR